MSTTQPSTQNRPQSSAESVTEVNCKSLDLLSGTTGQEEVKIEERQRRRVHHRKNAVLGLEQFQQVTTDNTSPDHHL